MSQLNQAIAALENEHAGFITKGRSTLGRIDETVTEARSTANTAMTERDAAQVDRDTINAADTAAGVAKDGAIAAMGATGTAHRGTHLAKRQVAEAVRQANQAKLEVDNAAAGDLSAYDHWLLSSPVANGTLHLDFANGTYQVWENGKLVDKTLAEAVTFTRASTATYWDANGVLQTAAVDEPRLDHDPVTGEALGLLVEESRTNLLPWSEDFSQTSWAKTYVTMQYEALTAPDGSIGVYKFVPTDVANQHSVSSAFSALAGTYTISAYFKAAEYTRAAITNYNPTDGAIQALYDLTSGQVVYVTAGASATITPCTDGWFLCTLTATWQALDDVDLRLHDQSTIGPRDWVVGDNVSGGYVWGAQLEQGTYPTSYIPTAGAAVTRSFDYAAVVDSTAFSKEEGSFFLQLRPAQVVGTNSRLSAKGSSYFLYLHQEHFKHYNNGASFLFPAIEDSPNRIAFAFTETTKAMGVNGASAAGDHNNGYLNTLPWEFQGGFESGKTSYHIGKVSHYPYAMPASELEALTA